MLFSPKRLLPVSPVPGNGESMFQISVRQEILALKAYVPGLSIAEIQQKYGLAQVIKMASNEN